MVVGSGPNGLAAALVLAAAGLEVEVVEAAPTIGGGARTAELTLPGFPHDVCSAVHPMAVASPFFRAFDLARHGVEMLQPEVAYAQPLDGGRAGLAWRDLDRTVDGPRRRTARPGASLLGPLAERWESVVGLLLSDFRSVPRDLATTGRLAARILEQGSPAWNRRFTGDVAPGPAHRASAPTRSCRRAAWPRPGPGCCSARWPTAVGWPIPRGGSQAIVDAHGRTRSAGLGGTIRTGERVHVAGPAAAGAGGAAGRLGPRPAGDRRRPAARVVPAAGCAGSVTAAGCARSTSR